MTTDDCVDRAFGRYELLECIGRGGMAEIYKARLHGPGGFEKILAIKRLLPFWSQNAEFVAMLVDEAKLLTHLFHPNIVHVYELGLEKGEVYIAMEYVRGFNLKQGLKAGEGRFSPADTVYMIRHILKGLHYAHTRKTGDGKPLSLVHRDISPQNILLGTEGAVKLTDFGIAKALCRSHEHTQTGVLKGKFAYMSPEQARGEVLDARSDLFSVGLVLFECLSGERYFTGKTDLAVLEEIKTHDLGERPLALLARCSEPMQPFLPVLRCALARDPDARYPSAQLFLQDLDRIAAELHIVSAVPRVMEEEAVQVLSPGAEPERTYTELSPEKTRILTDHGTVRTRAPVQVNRDDVRDLSALILSPQVPHHDAKGIGLRWVGGALLLCLSLALGMVALWPSADGGQQEVLSEEKEVHEAQDMIPIPIQKQEVIAPEENQAPPKQLAATHTNLANPANLVQPKPAGKLLVNVHPWARVSIMGIAGGLETPVARRLPEGNYTLLASRAGETLQAIAVVKADRETRCIGEFEEERGRGLRCQ